MDYKIQAFVTIPSLVDNTVGVVSALGELSSTASTFAREKQYFDIPSEFDAVSLVIFNCSDAASEGSISQQLEMTEALASPALLLSQSLFDNYAQETSVADFINGNVPGNFAVEFVSSSLVVDGKSLPKYIKVSFTTDTDSYNYELWYSDTEFRVGSNPYIGYEIVVIPPHQDMDTYMYAEYAIANTAYLDQQKNRKLFVTELNNIISQNPATAVETFELKWVDPSNQSDIILTEWTMVCYGNTAKTPTNLLRAIRDWVETDSAYDVDDWLSYFPDIETTDYFTFVPLWDQTSKVSSTDLLYSPIVRINRTIATVAKFFPTQDTVLTQSLMEVLPAKYNQLAVAVLPGLTNEATRVSFYGLFKDYSVLQINTPQAASYTDDTLAAIEAMESLLILAEEFNTLVPILPSGTTLVENAGSTPFRTLERSVGSYVFKVVTKESYLDVNI